MVLRPTWATIAAFVSIVTLAVASVAQEAPSGVRSFTRYQGDVIVKDAAGVSASMPVSVRDWSLAPGARIADLHIAGAGDVQVEVRIGELITESGGERESHPAGSFFVVPAGQVVSVTTIDDRSAVITTLAAGEAPK
jgi:hypothetical protein